MRSLHVVVATLSSLRARRTSKTEVKCEVCTSSSHPLVTSCSSDVRNCGEMRIFEIAARSDERVATTTCKLRISPQFWTSDEHEVTRGLRGDLKNSHFTTVSDVRRARSDERVVSRLDRPNPPCGKKRKKF